MSILQAITVTYINFSKPSHKFYTVRFFNLYIKGLNSALLASTHYTCETVSSSVRLPVIHFQLENYLCQNSKVVYTFIHSPSEELSLYGVQQQVGDKWAVCVNFMTLVFTILFVALLVSEVELVYVSEIDFFLLMQYIHKPAATKRSLHCAL